MICCSSIGDLYHQAMRHARFHKPIIKIQENIFKSNFENCKLKFKNTYIPAVSFYPLHGLALKNGFKCSNCLLFFVKFSTAKKHTSNCNIDSKPVPHKIQTKYQGTKQICIGIQVNSISSNNFTDDNTLIKIYESFQDM